MIKNTGFLYLRMIVVILISLYTSRILLKELGVNDFGLYSLVGGVVAIFSSLRGIFASSIQRFLNYEMGGKNNIEELRKIFSMGITIHLILCLIVLLLSETIGLWLLNNKLVINPDRLSAAHWVFQFSVFTTMITLMNVPFDALIIAHERMHIFAYISLIDSLLKLGIAFLLPIGNLDKLKFYAIMICIIAFIIRFISAMYCKRNFQECKYVFFWDNKKFKEIGGFAGWNFIGNSTFAMVNEGTNVFLNMFGGTAANASKSIAYQVRGAIMGFAMNMQTAVNPQITKLYAQNKKDEVFKILFTSSKYSFYVLLILNIPIILYTEPILEFWLGNIPIYAKSFIRLILFYSFIKLFQLSFSSLFKTMGKLKLFQIINSSITVLTLPISYIFLSNGAHLGVVYLLMIIMEIINIIALLFLSRKMGGVSIKQYLLKVIKPCVIVSCSIIILIYLLMYNHMPDNFLMLFVCIGACMLISVSCILVFGLSKSERNTIQSFIKKKLVK